jgi:hypothetical protein
MKLSAIRADGLDLPATGLRKAFDQLASTPNPVDAVSLSAEAIEASQHHIAYSLGMKTAKIEDEIASLSIDISG